MSESTTAQAPRTGWWRTFRRLPRWVRWPSYAVGALALVLVLALVTVVVLVRRPLPQTSGDLDVAGLEAPVTVIRDDHGIPQVYADSLADLMRAQGYVQAQDRFYEMDVRRHATAGTLAELFGRSALESDELVRTMGWRRVAARELALVQPRTRAALQDYADGVNAYLHSHSPSQIAVEYTVLNVGSLGYTPADWTPIDSLAWLKAMAWDLRGNLSDEIDRAIAVASVGEQRAQQLYPAYDFKAHAPIVNQGAVVDGVFEPDATRPDTRNAERPAYTAAQAKPLTRLRNSLAAMPALLGRGDGLGSNSWVVDGAHSSTGEPILAGDPHLGVGIPGVWMQMGLHCRTVSSRCPMDVAGFTFSGVPGVIIGHNADVAWGFTNEGPDVTDLYLERMRGEGADATVLYGDEYTPVSSRTETIKVKGEDDVTIIVRSTRHGPILSDVSGNPLDLDQVVGRARVLAPPDPGAPGAGEVDPNQLQDVRPGDSYAVALQWTALDPSPTADAILGLDLATDWDSFRTAAASFAVPAQNLVYADGAGHIGYQATGRVPVRKSGNDGMLPAAGWLPEDDWTGQFVPTEALPQVLDPKDGFVVTANQAVVGPGYPYFLTTDWDRGYRSQRIRDLLTASFAQGAAGQSGASSGGTVSVDDMSDLQLDDDNPMASVLTPYLLAVDLPGGYASDGQQLLIDWDGRQPASGPGSSAAAYFNVAWRHLLGLTFDDQLPASIRPDGGQRWYAVMAGLLDDPTSVWWDDTNTADVVETRDDVLRRAMLDARDELTSREALDPTQWTWGALHRLDLRSPTLGESGIGPVEALVNRDGWGLGGGSSAVDATSWDATAPGGLSDPSPYTVTTAPSMRMVVSMADLDESRWINLTGVSGHPYSGHYTDQTDLFARGQTLPWRFSSDAVQAAGEDTLTLRPSPAG